MLTEPTLYGQNDSAVYMVAVWIIINIPKLLYLRAKLLRTQVPGSSSKSLGTRLSAYFQFYAARGIRK